MIEVSEKKAHQSKFLAIKSCKSSEEVAETIKWTPGCDTLPSSVYLQKKTSLITFVGIPYHLTTIEVLDSLCWRVGKVLKFADKEPSFGGASGLRVLIKDC